MLSYRSFGSRLEGHPTPRAPWVDVATGSLGQGLPVGVGLALAGKRLDRLPCRVWVLCGDSEVAESSIWEGLSSEPARTARSHDVVALDGEVSNSTHAALFAKAHPERYFEMYIAEQQMVAAAVGMQIRGWSLAAGRPGRGRAGGTGRLAPRVALLAVRDMPGSGTSTELLHAPGIDADAFGAAARAMLAKCRDRTRA